MNKLDARHGYAFVLELSYYVPAAYSECTQGSHMGWATD